MSSKYTRVEMDNEKVGNQILYKSEKNIYDSLHFQKLIFTRIDFSGVQIQSHIPEVHATLMLKYF